MGDRRVWKAAAAVAAPLLVLLLFWGLRPRPYFTGTDSVEALTYVAPAPAGAKVCVPDLSLPAGTAEVRLNLLSGTTPRPTLRMTLHVGARTISSTLAPIAAKIGQPTNADFPIAPTSASPVTASASLGLTGSGQG